MPSGRIRVIASAAVAVTVGLMVSGCSRSSAADIPLLVASAAPSLASLDAEDRQTTPSLDSRPLIDLLPSQAELQTAFPKATGTASTGVLENTAPPAAPTAGASACDSQLTAWINSFPTIAVIQYAIDPSLPAPASLSVARFDTADDATAFMNAFRAAADACNSDADADQITALKTTSPGAAGLTYTGYELVLMQDANYVLEGTNAGSLAMDASLAKVGLKKLAALLQ